MMETIFNWLLQQNVWVEPILKVLMGFALIKYLIFGISLK